MIESVYTGNVHTIMVGVKDHENIDKLLSDKRVSRHSYQKKQGNWLIQLNAKEKYLYSNQTDQTLGGGECQSLASLQHELLAWSFAAGIPFGDIKPLRADFKFDYIGNEYPRWRKTADLVIEAYSAKHKPTPKNTYYGTTHIFGEHKSSKTKCGNHEMESYNKQIQNPGSPVDYRFELRSLKLNGLSIEGSLRYWIQELKSLKNYYDAALLRSNMMLLDLWNTTNNSRNKRSVKLSEFICCHLDGIYVRRQLSGLFDMMHQSNSNKKADYLCNKYGIDDCRFITKTSFEAFIDDLCKIIERYIDEDKIILKTGYFSHPSFSKQSTQAPFV